MSDRWRVRSTVMKADKEYDSHGPAALVRAYAVEADDTPRLSFKLADDGEAFELARLLNAHEDALARVPGAGS